MQTFIFDVSGMSCSGCTDRVQRMLGKLKGVNQVQVTLNPALATVVVDEALITDHQIEAAIQKLGYEAKIQSSD